MKVPLLDLKAQYRTIKPEVDAAVAEVFESQYFINGPKVHSPSCGWKTPAGTLIAACKCFDFQSNGSVSKPCSEVSPGIF